MICIRIIFVYLLCLWFISFQQTNLKASESCGFFPYGINHKHTTVGGLLFKMKKCKQCSHPLSKKQKKFCSPMCHGKWLHNLVPQPKISWWKNSKNMVICPNILIYALCDPDTGEIRYIGKSKNSMKRFKEHLSDISLRDNHRKNNWIKSLMKRGKIPNVKIIQKIDRDNQLNQAEIYWIKYFKKHGYNLTNMTDGGDGGYTGGEGLGAKPVIAINIFNRKKKEYKSVQDTKRDGFSPSRVSSVCLGKRHRYRNFIFYFKNKKRNSSVNVFKLKNLKTNQQTFFMNGRLLAKTLKMPYHQLTYFLKSIRDVTGKYEITFEQL